VLLSLMCCWWAYKHKEAMLPSLGPAAAAAAAAPAAAVPGQRKAPFPLCPPLVYIIIALIHLACWCG